METRHIRISLKAYDKIFQMARKKAAKLNRDVTGAEIIDDILEVKQ